MRIVSLVSQKGGAGKSTLARQLAVLAGEGGETFLVDRDPQATTRKWAERRHGLDPQPGQPQFLDLGETPLEAAAAQLRERPGTLFIDTAPQVTETVAQAVRVSDLVIVPVRPSPDDLEAVPDTLAMLARLKKRAVIIVNAAKNERRATDARAALSCWPVPVCPHHVVDRAVYLDAALAGMGVGEMQGAASRMADQELRRIWAWIETSEEAADV